MCIFWYWSGWAVHRVNGKGGGATKMGPFYFLPDLEFCSFLDSRDLMWGVYHTVPYLVQAIIRNSNDSD